MNFQEFVNSVRMPCCVLSVEKSRVDKYGDIRIVCSNTSYREIMGPKYYDNMPYYELVPQDNKFEDFCYRSAILQEKMHAYVETKALGYWTDQTLIPLESDDENIGYCQFIFEFTKEPEADRMASVSANTSAFIIEACIKLMRTNDFQKNVDDVMENILETSEADGCRIMLVNHKNREAIIFSESFRPNAWPDKTEKDVIDYNLISTWEDIIGVSNILILNGKSDFEWLDEHNLLWSRSMQENGVHNLILLPLRKNNIILGYLYVVNFNPDKLVDIKEMLELLSFFLSSEISNNMLMHQLDLMSTTDELTGLNNRHAMTKTSDNLKKNKTSLGVMSLDLNGLKVINDGQGHEAGDKLLVKASELLRKVFRQDDIFRTGGDEFVIIIKNISEETFEKKVLQLRNIMEQDGTVSFAIGHSWSAGDEDFQTVFRQADERMYSDKDLCHRQHPEWNRR